MSVLCQTHSAGNVEFPPSCSHDPPPLAQWMRSFLTAPEALEGQEGQVDLGDLEDQEVHVVRQS